MPKEMGELEKAKPYAQCVSLWGIYPQMCMVTEELAELIVAVNRFDRGRATAADIAEEIADVNIMTKQLMHVVGLSETQVKEKEIEKMERLKERVEAGLEKKRNRGRD